MLALKSQNSTSISGVCPSTFTTDVGHGVLCHKNDELLNGSHRCSPLSALLSSLATPLRRGGGGIRSFCLPSDEAGLKKLTIASGEAEAEIFTLGGCVTSFKARPGFSVRCKHPCASSLFPRPRVGPSCCRSLIYCGRLSYFYAASRLQRPCSGSLDNAPTYEFLLASREMLYRGFSGLCLCLPSSPPRKEAQKV